MQTPFFPQFRARLAACKQHVRQLEKKALHQLEALFAKCLPPGALAPTDQGPNSRQRLFPIRCTFWAFLYQVFHPDCPCRQVVHHIQAALDSEGPGTPISSNTGAYCQARLRLPLDLLQRLRHSVAAYAQRLLPKAQELWFGLRPIVIDGTTISLPDTPTNQAAYPQSRTQKPGCGFPLMRLLGVFSLCTGCLLDYIKGNKHQSELAMLMKLLGLFKPGDLVLGDRGFCGYAQIALFLAQSVMCLFRLHQSRSSDLRRGQRLGKCDRIFIWRKPAHKPPYLPNTVWKRLPEELTVRVLRFNLQVRGFRTESVTLVTTLLDPDLYPAHQIAALYARRWSIELWFRDIKTTMGMELLRCKSPKMVHKELEMFLIAYNMIRALALEAAMTHQVPLDRVSFQGTIDAALEYSVPLAQAKSNKRREQLMGNLLWIIATDLVPKRPGRREPRALKRRHKNYPLLNKPRHKYRETAHRNRYRKTPPRNLLELI